MRVLLTGANGWIGSAVAVDLIEAGHTVVGLVRSSEKGEALAAAGGTPLVGSLGDLDVLREATEAADGVIHTAFGLDFARYTELSREDSRAIEMFAEVYAGSDRPIVVTSGLGVLDGDDEFTEDARPEIIPDYPRASEQTAFALAASGVRMSVVRPARSVHGLGEPHGFVPLLAGVAVEQGFSAYVDDGSNLWPAVHRDDAARVYRLALESRACNEAFHAVAEGVPFREVAQVIGDQLGLPTRSVTLDEASEHFGGLAMWLTGRATASNDKTRATLRWEPIHTGLLADIDRPEYYAHLARPVA